LLHFYQIPGTSKQGTGIGLSLVKSIIEAHNGRIEVGSPLTGNGTIFSIMLPLYANESQTTVQDNDRFHLEKFMEDDITNTESNSSTENDQSLPVLLIVEDNDEMRNFLYENFNQEYQVLTAMHGLDALECLKSKDIDLIISDLMMPKMDGIELCQKIRANYLFSHIPFVMLTARTDLDSKIQGLNCGADAYVEKPFSILHIKAIIDNLLESRRMLRKKFSDMPFVPISTIAVNNADEQFLAKLNEIIDQNIDNENFNIEQLAESLCISRSGLFSKIKTLAGITPNDMIQLIRLKKAAAYILEGKHRINEIAYMVGFSNPSYFSKCFQKQFGMTPKEFEKQNKAL
jgi:DNA-binding response OmpR family regulator